MNDDIKQVCLESTEVDPVLIAKKLMALPGVPVHGPVHHMLDGAALLVAIHNAGADINFEACLDELFVRGEKMPGAICGQWGVCGSAASVGAALAAWHGTGPLSSNTYYADNMELTSAVLAEEARLGGPRCCKRNAYTALLVATQFVKEKYGVNIHAEKPACVAFALNDTCLKGRCPYYPVSKSAD